GHALNKCLKDFVVKSKTMAGFDSPYIPGWDCHGLPIEIKVDESLGRKKLEMQAIDVRRACREYAQKYLDLQRSQFKRIGVFGRWDDPYSTMSQRYESIILRQFYDFLERGFVFKGLRPVYWCIHDRTALAEAEVEYEMHTSPSVYVKYALTSDPAQVDAALAGKKVGTIIWTTTPWTLPASMAIAFHPELDYVGLEADGAVYIVAEALVESTRQNANLIDLKDARVVARFKGARLDRVEFQHPFLERKVLGVLADYVTTEQGTGAVHTAPSHGADDFYTGAKYGLDQTTRVDEAGRMRHGQPEYEGLTVFKANPRIIEVLKQHRALMGEATIVHSYPHCWRCHNPVIFRATEQWFIGMDRPMPDGSGTLRSRALDEIKNVEWDPSWGEERISNMIATRPDWCISRQRIWGVPLAVFFCEGCNALLEDKQVNAKIVELFEREGADAWYTRSAKELLPAGLKCGSCECMEFRKEMDIVDVWFESGSSYEVVLTEPGMRFPADLYTEGGDQHRGWFHSSLLCSTGIRGAAPYRAVATSGWTLDAQGRAFSKSLGNGVDPVDIANRLGGEIVRLWVASVDFREDVHASEELMQRVSENYRKIRNTFRAMLQNLYDFDPQKHEVAFDEMDSFDQHMLLLAADLSEELKKWYEEFQFHRIYQRVVEFCTNELSKVYLDVSKDRLYTFAPDHKSRRSAQTVLWRISDALARLLAPLMSFTADEIWEFLPADLERAPSIHLTMFPERDELAPANSATDVLRAEWVKLMWVRDEALKALEEARNAKLIGSALEAEVTIAAPPGIYDLLQRHEQDLIAILIVSGVKLRVEAGEGAEEGFAVTVARAPGSKCDRCWHYSNFVGSDPEFPTVCERCAPTLREILKIADSRQLPVVR
ncbi:MAG: isoleucine--tRNA ligase, partial [Acidobacteriaceae bacterium]